MACYIIVYFHHRVCIFFCVRAHTDGCLARAWILSLEVRSLYMVFIKDTNFHAR